MILRSSIILPVKVSLMYLLLSTFRPPKHLFKVDCNGGAQMGTVTKIPGNTPDISRSNPVAENAGGSAPPEEAKPNA